MKIGILARRFWPDIGGVEKHVLEIGKRLVKDGHEVTVITQSKGTRNNIDGIRIKRISKVPANWFDKFYIWKWFWNNRSLIKQLDIIHAHDVYFWYFPFRVLFPRKKSFITFHGYENYPISRRAILVRKISEKFSKGNIIVGSFIKKWYGTMPDYITYGAVEVSSIKYQALSSRKRESAVFVGRLEKNTGILSYLEAVGIIKKLIPNFEFTIIGDGELKDKIPKEIRIYKSDRGVEKYLRESNFVFASGYLSILEAFVNKRLVFVFYDNPLKEDYLKMTPFSKFMIIENSPEKLADKVLYYLNHQKEAEELKRKAFDWAKDQTWENVVKIYYQLWEK